MLYPCQVDLLPTSILQASPSTWAAIQITRWASPVLGIIFFLFFGLAGESMLFYRGLIDRVAQVLHIKQKPSILPM